MTQSSSISVLPPSLLVHSNRRDMSFGQPNSMRVLWLAGDCSHNLQGSFSEPSILHTEDRERRGNHDGQRPDRALKTQRFRPAFGSVRRPETRACRHPTRINRTFSPGRAKRNVLFPGSTLTTLCSTMTESVSGIFTGASQWVVGAGPTAVDVRTSERAYRQPSAVHPVGRPR